MSNTTDFESIRRQLASTIHAHWKLFLAQGIVMMVLGFLAIAVPNLATLAVEIFVGWLFFVGGIFRAVSVWHSRQAPGFAWSILTAVLSVVLGLILILRPLEGALTLTMVLVAFFVSRGSPRSSGRSSTASTFEAGAGCCSAASSTCCSPT